ncbi:MAG: hypothetical protein MI866_11335 [Bacteroidales bacterium]|nr:hypothetical protein [Bacteroidales bacterium]
MRFKFVFAIILLLNLVENTFVYGKQSDNPINKQIFTIHDYSKHPLKSGADFQSKLRKSLKKTKVGAIVSLKTVNNELFLYNDDEDQVSASYFIDVLVDVIVNKKQYIIPIIIDYDGDLSFLKSVFEESKLDDYLIDLDVNEPNPTLSFFTSKGKRLLIFVQHPNQTRKDIKGFNNYDDHIIDSASSIKQSESLLFYMIKNLNDKKSLDSLSDYHYYGGEVDYVNAITNEWKRTGIFPSFLLTSQMEGETRSIMEAINNTPKIEGKIVSTDTLFNSEYVSWKEYPGSKTPLNFCLPFERGVVDKLSPDLPGYKFNPVSVSLDGYDDNSPFFIRAEKYELSDMLSGFYTFNENFKDQTGRNNPIGNYGVQVVDDVERGSVASFLTGNFIELPKASQYDIQNNSMTISVWVNFLPTDNEYIAVLGGSQGIYRRGLQLAIRQQKAYFGFWSLDIHGKSALKPNRWYHIVARYDKASKTVSLFVNGEKEAESDNFLSYLGSGNLFIGRSARGHTYAGKIDDLIIWNRSLGNDEIEKLYNNKEIEVFNYRVIAIVVISFLLLSLIALGIVLIRKWKHKHIIDDTSDSDSEFQLKIYLFGGFCIELNTGEDITKQISPKGREILILLILNYILNPGQSISSKEVAALIWKDMSTDKALNNRRVTTSRLNKSLNEIEGLNLIIDDNNNIQLIVGDSVWIDFEVFNKFPKDEFKAHITPVLEIISRGVFLKNQKAEWMDAYISDVYQKVMDGLIELLKENELKPEALIKTANLLLQREPTCEEAMIFLVRYYKKSDKHHLAELTYRHFCENYNTYYEEDYNVQLSEL